MVEKTLSFDGLCFSYNDGQLVMQAYRGEIERGKIMAILGPNGCGKTTLLKLLIGALVPQEGKIDIEGRVAFVPQILQVSFPYTVLDMVLMGRARRIGLFSIPSTEDEQAAVRASFCSGFDIFPAKKD